MGPGLFWNFPSKTSCTVSQTLLQTMYVVLLVTVARRLFFSGIQSIPSFLFVRLLFHIKFHRPNNRDVCPCHLEENTFTDLCCMQATNHCTAWSHIHRLQVNSGRLCKVMLLFLTDQSVHEFIQKHPEITCINSHTSIPVFFLAVEQSALVDLLMMHMFAGLNHIPKINF